MKDSRSQNTRKPTVKRSFLEMAAKARPEKCYVILYTVPKTILAMQTNLRAY